MGQGHGEEWTVLAGDLVEREGQRRAKHELRRIYDG